MTTSMDSKLRTHQPLPELLSLLVRENASGIVHISGHSVVRKIFLVEGEIRAAISSLESEKVGSWLVGRGIITERQKTQALRTQSQTKSPEALGSILLAKSVLSHDELREALESLGLAIIQRASADQNVMATFSEKIDLRQPDTMGSLSTSRFILETARHFPNRMEKIRRIGELSQFIRAEGEVISLSAELDLTPSEAFVLSRISGTKTIQDLVRLIPKPEEETLDIIYALSRCGLLHIGPALKPTPLSKKQQRASREARRIVDEEELSKDALKERKHLQEMARHLSQMNHYQIFGVGMDASLREISREWEKLKMQCRPERAGETHLLDMESTLNSILEQAHSAYELLSDPPRRRRYDRILKELASEQPHEESRIHRGETDAGLRSEMVEANIKRADEMIRDGEIYLAIQLLEQACALEPRPEELVKLARLMLRNPLWHRRAQRALRTALDVDPKYVEGWLELAEFWRRKNHKERQRKAIERALTIDSTHPKAVKMYEQLMGAKELKQFLRISRPG